MRRVLPGLLTSSPRKDPTSPCKDPTSPCHLSGQGRLNLSVTTRNQSYVDITGLVSELFTGRGRFREEPSSINRENTNNGVPSTIPPYVSMLVRPIIL